MAERRVQSIRIRETLTSFLPRRELEALAAEAGVMKRQRKISIHALFWTVVLGFGTGRDRTLAALRRAFELTTELRVAPSSFYARFTPAFERFMKRTVEHVMSLVAHVQGQLSGTLSSFRDLVIADATVIRLHELLATTYPACRTNHTKAALKLHTVLSVCAAWRDHAVPEAGWRSRGG